MARGDVWRMELSTASLSIDEMRHKIIPELLGHIGLLTAAASELSEAAENLINAGDHDYGCGVRYGEHLCDCGWSRSIAECRELMKHWEIP